MEKFLSVKPLAFLNYNMVRPRVHIWFFLGLLVVAGGGAAVFLSVTNPQTAAPWQFVILYLAVFVALWAAATIVGYGARVVFWPKGLRAEHLRAARRQAALLGFLGVSALILMAGGIFNISTAALLFLIFMLIELYAQ